MSRLVVLLLLGLACNEAGLRVSNKAPEAQIVDPADGGEVREGYAVTLVGAATDDDNAASDLEARWRIDGEEVCSWSAPAEDGTALCDATFAGDSAGEVVFEVRDPRSGSASDRIAVVVVPTDAPSAMITQPVEDGVYYSDQLTTLAGIVGDAEDEPADLIVVWTSSVDEADLSAVNTTPTTDGTLSGSAILPEGMHELRLTATDTTGKTGSDTVHITVGPPNSAPTCAITAPLDRSGGELGQLLFIEGATGDDDVPADLLTVTFESSLDGVLDTVGPDTDGTVSLPWSDLTVGTHTLTMTVADEVDALCTASVAYTVGTPPQVAILAPVEGAVYAIGDPVAIEAEVSDTEDRPSDLALSWESSMDGVLDTNPADGDGSAGFVTRALSAGSHTLTLTGTDSAGLVDTDRVTFLVNTPPTAPIVRIEPEDPTTLDNLVAVLDPPALDADGDPLTTTWAWFVDGVPSPASISEVLDAGETTRDERWTVSVTVSDGLHESAPVEAITTILNSPPTLADAVILPAAPRSDEDLLCVPGAATDADGDAISSTFRWTIDGLDAGVSLATLPADRTRSDMTVQCFVTPSDGTLDGTPASAEVRIGNTAPELLSVTLGPDPATVTDVLLCTPGLARDADDDPLSFRYAWSLDDIRTADVGDTLAAPAEGTEVVCWVTPDDGTDLGAEVASNPVRIDDSPPVVTAVTLSPAEATEATTLTCTATAEDADGEPVTLAYTWTVDGLAVDDEGPTLTGGTFDKGDAVACTATPVGGVGLESDPVVCPEDTVRWAHLERRTVVWWKS